MGAQVEVDLAVRYVRLLFAAGDLLEPGISLIGSPQPVRILSSYVNLPIGCRSASDRRPRNLAPYKRPFQYLMNISIL